MFKTSTGTRKIDYTPRYFYSFALNQQWYDTELDSLDYDVTFGPFCSLCGWLWEKYCGSVTNLPVVSYEIGWKLYESLRSKEYEQDKLQGVSFHFLQHSMKLFSLSERVFVLWKRLAKFYFRSSARVGTLLEQLQKLCLAGSEAKYDQEKLDVEQLRYVTNKIQQLLSSQGNGYSYVI